MTDLLIPDWVFEKLVCCECDRYLSVGPVKVRGDGKSVCGRCKDDQLPSHEAFDVIIKQLYFPCVHRNNGCTSRLLYEEAMTHEKYCPFREYQCPAKPLSDCTWTTGTIFNLIEHIECEHPTLLTEKPNFDINVTEIITDYRLIRFKETNMLLQFTCEQNESKIIFKITPIGSFGFNVHYNHRITIRNSCSSYDEVDSPNRADFKITRNINDTLTFEKESLLNMMQHPETFSCEISAGMEEICVVNRLRSLEETALIENTKCSNCNVILVPPIYKCPMEHYLCEDCTGYDHDMCTLCDKRGIEFYQEVELETHAKGLLLRCRWNEVGCNEAFSSEEIKQHEQICAFRTYKCVLNSCKWSGCLNDLITHMGVYHPHIKLENGKIWKIPKSEKNHDHCILIADRELFDCKVIKESDMIEFYVLYNGLPRLRQHFKCAVEIVAEEDEDKNALPKRTYNFHKTRSNDWFTEYRVKLTKDDLTRFKDKYDIHVVITSFLNIYDT